MKGTDWLTILARIAPQTPLDLDGLPEVSDPAGPQVATAVPVAPPSARLWQPADPAAAFMGVRVTQRPADAARLAIRLASAALERGVTPIILSTLPKSGFEQFGFRVERLPAAPEDERRRAEAELARFWGLTIIIDADDIALLG
jgi:hypothetical protein